MSYYFRQLSASFDQLFDITDKEGHFFDVLLIDQQNHVIFVILCDLCFLFEVGKGEFVRAAEFTE